MIVENDCRNTPFLALDDIDVYALNKDMHKGYRVTRERHQILIIHRKNGEWSSRPIEKIAIEDKKNDGFFFVLYTKTRTNQPDEYRMEYPSLGHIFHILDIDSTTKKNILKEYF